MIVLLICSNVPDVGSWNVVSIPSCPLRNSCHSGNDLGPFRTACQSGDPGALGHQNKHLPLISVDMVTPRSVGRPYEAVGVVQSHSSIERECKLQVTSCKQDNVHKDEARNVFARCVSRSMVTPKGITHLDKRRKRETILFLPDGTDGWRRVWRKSIRVVSLPYAWSHGK